MKYSISLLIIMTALAGADTLLVPSEYPSIQSGINASQNGDTVLVSTGEYGGPISFLDKNIVVRSTGGSDFTLIRTFSDYHCVSITGGQDSTAVLEGFTIRNQISDGAASGKQKIVDHGGGIYITNSSPTILNSVINNCVTDGSGAGIYVSNSSSRIENCTISDNHAYGAVTGGGIRAVGNSIGDRPFRIIDCTVVGNESSTTGGMSITHQNAEIINNMIINNNGGSSGQGAGGIGISSLNVLLYSNCISGNDGATGGGVSISGGSPTIIGNLIVENTAGYGGGIYDASGSTIHLENNTIAFNTALGTAGVFGGGIVTTNDTLYLENTILWGNIGSPGSQILMADAHVSVKYCNIEYGEDSVYNFASSTLYWGPGNIDIDPQFETGPLGDYHLSLSSPCIDAGNPASQYNDPEDPFNPGYALWPAMGYLRNDMGAFGGGGVNYWLTVEEEEISPIEGELSLRSFPNPFTSSCTVCYQLDEASHVNLSVFDLSGRLVEILVDKVVPSGQYSEYFDGSDLYSGMYLIRLVAGDLSTSRRCIVIR